MENYNMYLFMFGISVQHYLCKINPCSSISLFIPVCIIFRWMNISQFIYPFHWTFRLFPVGDVNSNVVMYILVHVCSHVYSIQLGV